MSPTVINKDEALYPQCIQVLDETAVCNFFSSYWSQKCMTYVKKRVSFVWKHEQNESFQSASVFHTEGLSIPFGSFEGSCQGVVRCTHQMNVPSGLAAERL